ncbi:C-type lectin domain family 5 member A [Hipposideros larvatus]
MNWHMIISGLIVVVLKIVGTTLFLLYFPQIFGKGNDSFSPSGSNGTVPPTFRRGYVSAMPTESSGTVCPRRWDFHQGRCFFLSTSEMSWNQSRDYCETEASTLAIVNNPEKLMVRYPSPSPSKCGPRRAAPVSPGNLLGMYNKFLVPSSRPTEQEAQQSAFQQALQNFLQRITGAEKHFVGLLYQNAEKRWRWIDKSIFNGNVTNQQQNFNCVTIGLTKTFDAALCDTKYRWICERSAEKAVGAV